MLLCCRAQQPLIKCGKLILSSFFGFFFFMILHSFRPDITSLFDRALNIKLLTPSRHGPTQILITRNLRGCRGSHKNKKKVKEVSRLALLIRVCSELYVPRLFPHKLSM